MGRQKNNVSRLRWELRERICELLFDGATYEDMRRALAEDTELTLHNSSIQAYMRSDEFRRYREYRQQFDSDARERRAIWSAISAGEGMSSGLEAAEYLSVRNLIEQLQGDDLEVKDTAKLASAVARFRGNEVKELKAEHKRRVQALEERHAAELKEMKAEIEALTARLQKARDSLSAKAGAVDPQERARMIAAMDEYMAGAHK